MDLFTPQVDPETQHPIFRNLLHAKYAPERILLTQWAKGFRDRDGKFVKQFQQTFESGLWELYLNAAISAWGMKIDMSFSSPDFVITAPTNLCIEATIAAPAQGGKPAYGYGKSDIPEDFTNFNIEASLRIANSFASKVKRYREYYGLLPQSRQQPYVIGIGAFDRPFAHFAASRPVLAAVYGLYHDESATDANADKVVSYNVRAAPKSKTTSVPLGLFCDPTFADVSAVIYSSLATWGKVRALADNATAPSVYATFHPLGDSLLPEVRRVLKRDYKEHVLDGMYVLHNPFATYPIPPGVLSHPRLAEVRVAPDGELIISAPEDFLLSRTLFSFPTLDAAERGLLELTSPSHSQSTKF
jgi:hypothetical protein